VTKARSEDSEQFIDLFAFDKIIKKFEAKQNQKLENLNQLDSIFGDESFYKDDDDENSSEEQDKFYKLPIPQGGTIESLENYTTVCCLFWFKDFDSMMSEKGLEHTFHFYHSLKVFFYKDN